jgi:uncharacterized protein (DUF1778 family)
MIKKERFEIRLDKETKAMLKKQADKHKRSMGVYLFIN